MFYRIRKTVLKIFLSINIFVTQIPRKKDKIGDITRPDFKIFQNHSTKLVQYMNKKRYVYPWKRIRDPDILPQKLQTLDFL